MTPLQAAAQALVEELRFQLTTENPSDPIAAVRAVLQAIREPSEAMVNAGHMKMPIEYDMQSKDGRVVVTLKERSQCVSPAGPWQAMLDALLS